MKILYVITSTETGGAEKALSHLVHALAPHHTIKVVCLKPLGTLGKQLAQDGIETVSLEMQGVGVGMVSKLVEVIRQFQPDLVHALLFRAIEFSRLACAGRNIKLVTTPHFDFSQKSLSMRLLDRALKSIDAASTAESLSTYDYLLKHQHYLKGKTYLIGNSIPKKQFFPDANLKKSMRSTHGFTADDCIFISVARLAPVKNPRGLLAAFEKILPACPHAKLVYVGEGEERNALEKYIQQHLLSKCVLLAGEQKEVNPFLNMADVFVQFSVEESLPLSLLEAQQVGLPCVVSKVGDMPRQVEHGKGGFVCTAKDEMLLSCLMTELYNNPALRQEMGSYSLQKSATIVDSSQQYQQLYQQLVGKQG